MKKAFALTMVLFFVVGSIAFANAACLPTALQGSQQALASGADLDFIRVMKDEYGLVHPDGEIYVHSSGTDAWSACDPSSPQQRIYKLNPGSPPSISLWNVPQAEDLQAGDNQTFPDVIKTSDGTKHVFFTTNSPRAKIYYNAQNSQGVWQHNQSQKIIDLGNGTLAVVDVLWDESSPFYNPHNSQYYKGLMYFINQAGCWASGAGTAGVLAVAYCNDPLNWVGPYDVGNPNCNFNQALHTEQGGAMYYNGCIYLMLFEGKISAYYDEFLDGTTMTRLYYATPANPENVTVLQNGNYLTANGIYAPGAGGYENTKALISVTMAFDPTSGNMYMGRTYTYPVNYSGYGDEIPCYTGGICFSGLLSRTIRAQLYSMNLGSPPSMMGLWTGSWTLMGDWGASHGYSMEQ